MLNYNFDKYGFINSNQQWNMLNENVILKSYSEINCNDFNLKRSEKFSLKSNNNLDLGSISTGPLHQYSILKEYFDKIKTKKALALTGSAGTVVFFHCRTIHSSGHNHLNSNRPLILFGYRACDAWPIFNDGNPHPEVDLENYDKNIIIGKSTIKPRSAKVPVIIPLPKKKHFVSIYQLQNEN